MVLIISDRVEETEIEVCDWVRRLNSKCEIISTVDFLNDINIDYNNKSKNVSFFLNGIYVKSIWVRRDRFSSKNYLQNNIPKIININLDLETDTLKEFILEKGYNNMNILSSYSNIKLNKLKVLRIASDVGLMVPDYIITNRKKTLKQFIKEHNKVISKASYENLQFNIKSKNFFQYVEVFDKTGIKKIPNKFFPSFFQKFVPQKYEIRAFYFNGEIYAMANILSDRLSGDIRRTGYVIRRIPYIFHQIDIEKITLLMNNLNLTIGALDFIIDYKDKVHFLEVNPNGNFLVTSKKSNYNLEEKVANYLVYG